MIEALIEARHRGLVTIAMVGYDGGRMAAEGLADHVVVTRSQHIPASRRPRRAPTTRCASWSSRRVSTPPRRRRARSGARRGHGAGGRFRPYVFRLATELGLAGFVLNDERGVLLEVEGKPDAVERFLARLPREAPPLAAVERRRDRGRARPGEAGSRSSPAPARRRDAPVSPDTATCDECLAELFDPATAATATRS